MSYIAAFDQGTTSSRCLIFDHDAQVVSSAQQDIARYFPRPGWVEQDAMEIWASQIGMFTKALSRAQLSAGDIAAIGITNQRETSVVWNRTTGEPIAPAPVWQCRRGAPLIDELVAAGHGETIQAKTGLVPDAYFSASKVRWILDNVPGARATAEAGELAFGTIDSWLIYKLTGGTLHATDYTNASRTMLFNIHTLNWDDELLNLFDIPRSMLPEIRPSSGSFGEVDGDYGRGIPLMGVLGDQQAALFGQCCFGSGQAKATYGTGAFVLLNTGEHPVQSKNGLLTTIAFSSDAKAEAGTKAGTGDVPRVTYALEGSVYSAGSTIKWLRDELHLIRTAEETEELARQIDDTAGVYLVPAFNGLGAPYWDSAARGVIVGLTQGAGRAQVVRAALESVGFQVADVLRAMSEDVARCLPGSCSLHDLRVDGGVSHNDFAMQFQADVLGAEVLRPRLVETTALGVAFAAGLAVGYWSNFDALCAHWQLDRTFTPSRPANEVAALVGGWQHAVSQARL